MNSATDNQFPQGRKKEKHHPLRLLHPKFPKTKTLWPEPKGRTRKVKKASLFRLLLSVFNNSNPKFTFYFPRHISDMIATLPTYQWLTAMSQILSRICHKSPGVSDSCLYLSLSLVLAVLSLSRSTTHTTPTWGREAPCESRVKSPGPGSCWI